MRPRIWLVLLGLALFALLPSSARAAFPGANGKIAFDSNRECDEDVDCPLTKLFTMNADGGGQSTLLPELAHDAAWSPDGSKLAFTAEPGTPSTGPYIGIVNADGSGRAALTPSFLKSHDTEPSWSPDGERIAFTRFVPEAGFFGMFEIFVMDADGTNPTRLTNSDPAAGAFGGFEPAWSPDGSRIAFTRAISRSTGGVDDEIYLMNTDGTDLVNITNNPMADRSPAWSPDGTQIAFTSQRDGTAGVHVMNADGTGVRHVVNAGFPAWSPDGTRIAFARQQSTPPNTGYQISVIRVDGTGEATLTSSGMSDNFRPDWQPLNRPPDCASVTATPASLWPPNHKLVTVSLTAATDLDGGSVTVTATGVTSDEPARGDFALGPATDQVRLRAERDGGGDGRVYTIAFEAADANGAKCTGDVTVAVPRHK